MLHPFRVSVAITVVTGNINRVAERDHRAQGRYGTLYVSTDKPEIKLQALSEKCEAQPASSDALAQGSSQGSVAFPP